MCCIIGLSVSKSYTKTMTILQYILWQIGFLLVYQINYQFAIHCITRKSAKASPSSASITELIQPILAWTKEPDSSRIQKPKPVFTTLGDNCNISITLGKLKSGEGFCHPWHAWLFSLAGWNLFLASWAYFPSSKIKIAFF